MNVYRDGGNRNFPRRMLNWMWIVGLLAGIFWWTSAGAHGGGTPQLSGEAAGPYRIYAWSSPDPWRVGDVHLDVAVARATEQETETPVIDAQVQLHLTHAESGSTLTMAAEPLAYLNSFYYEAGFALPEPGNWQVEVQVATDAGEGAVDFMMDAEPARTVNWLLIGVGIGLLLVVAVLLGFWSRQDGAQSQHRKTRRAAQGQNPRSQPRNPAPTSDV